MFVKKILKVLLLLLGIVFVIFHGYEFEVMRAALGIVIFSLFTVLYINYTKKRSKYFLWFLVLFTMANLVDLASFYWPIYDPEVLDNFETFDYYYFAINSLFILAYVALIIKIAVRLNLKKVLRELSIPIVVLLILDVFCVILVTDAAQQDFTLYEYALEFCYNAVVMILLSIALINYMYRNDNKSMLFLIASIFILFSEIIQLAYYYVLEDNSLSFAYSLFFVIAMIFFYLQSQKQFKGPIAEYLDEELGGSA